VHCTYSFVPLAYFSISTSDWCIFSAARLFMFSSVPSFYFLSLPHATLNHFLLCILSKHMLFYQKKVISIPSLCLSSSRKASLRL
jgi:hypothetical protein